MTFPGHAHLFIGSFYTYVIFRMDNTCSNLIHILCRQVFLCCQSILAFICSNSFLPPLLKQLLVTSNTWDILRQTNIKSDYSIKVNSSATCVVC